MGTVSSSIAADFGPWSFEEAEDMHSQQGRNAKEFQLLRADTAVAAMDSKALRLECSSQTRQLLSFNRKTLCEKPLHEEKLDFQLLVAQGRPQHGASQSLKKVKTLSLVVTTCCGPCTRPHTDITVVAHAGVTDDFPEAKRMPTPAAASPCSTCSCTLVLPFAWLRSLTKRTLTLLSLAATRTLNP